MKGDELADFVRRYFKLQHSGGADSGCADLDIDSTSDRNKHLSDSEARLLTLRQAGLEKEDESGPADWRPLIGDGYEANLRRAIFGWTKREYQRVWEGRVGSIGITGADFHKAYNAVAFANRLGTVMNVHAAILWGTVDQTNGIETAKVARRFLERFRKWCHERGLPCRWVHVFEVGKKKGLHSHVLMHVPRLYELEFRRWVNRCIKTVTGKEPVPCIMPGMARRLGIARPSHTANVVARADVDIRAQWELFCYVMKGLPSWVHVHDVDDRRKTRPLTEVAGIRHRPQGEVLTKRVGVAREIDRTSQDRRGFRSAYDNGAIQPDQLYISDYFREFERDKDQEELQRILARLEI